MKPQHHGRVLTATQERTLLHKHLTGGFPPRCLWTTIRALIITGMLVEDSQQDLVVTAKGKAYCEAHHMDIPSPR